LTANFSLGANSPWRTADTSGRDQEADVDHNDFAAIPFGLPDVGFCIVTPLKAHQRKIDCNSTD
jgi:hypothetical protein